MKSKAWLVLLGGAVIATALAVGLPAGQRGVAAISAGVLVLIAAVAALNASPAGIAFVERRAGGVKAAGWALVVLGVAVVAVAPFSPYPAARFGWILYLGAGLSLTGFMAVRLPRMLREVGAVHAEPDRRAAAGPYIRAEARGFHGVSEGLAAVASVARNAGAVLQIVGPWVVLLIVSGLVALLAVTSGSEGPGRSLLVEFLLCLPLSLLLLAAVPTVIVAWTRWSVRGERPRHWIALPDRAAMSVAWRLWVAFSVMGVVEGLVSSQAWALSTKLGGWPDVTAVVVGNGVEVVLIAVATGFGLQLIALALGNKAFDQGIALFRTRALWPGLPLGMMVALLPFTAAGTAIDLWQQHLNYGAFNPLTGLFLLGSALAGFGALIAATTYAARVYEAVREPDLQIVA